MRVLALRKLYNVPIKVVVRHASSIDALEAAGKRCLVRIELQPKTLKLMLFTRCIVGVPKADICPIDILQFGLIAQSILCPGSTTLLQNLTVSCSLDESIDYSNEPWKGEYLEGASNEIYQIPLINYGKKNYREIIESIYMKTNGMC